MGPFAGALVDRLDRWRTLWNCDVARVLVTGALVLLILTDRAGITVLAVISFLLTSITTLAENLPQAIVPDVAGGGSLDSANSRLMGGQLVSGEFLGAPLGTAPFALGQPVPFAVDTLSFAVFAALVFSIRLSGARPSPTAAGRPTARAVVTETADGIRRLWRHRVLRTVCVLVGALAEAAGLGWDIPAERLHKALAAWPPRRCGVTPSESARSARSTTESGHRGSGWGWLGHDRIRRGRWRRCGGVRTARPAAGVQNPPCPAAEGPRPCSSATRGSSDARPLQR